ncbi:MAG: B12-binding domain-containing radical SAM protein [Thermoleophilia bacterium]|jgi:radical SAM superfamily enzyme YgiQ (UPF0313 family)
MRVLLLQPREEKGVGLQSLLRVEPLGLEMIAGALSTAHEVDLLDLRADDRDLDSVLSDFRPEVVGISSSFTMGAPQALNIAMHVKALCPETFIVMGGQHPSLLPTDFHHEAVHAIVVGEGEAAFRELIDALAVDGDLATIPGLVLNRPDRQEFTKVRRPLADLDTLPFPQRSLTRHIRGHYHLFRRSPIASIETTRGCPHQCSFCAVWRFYQGKVRFKSPERVVRELEMIEERDVFFTDDNFLANANRTKVILDLIRQRGLDKRYFVQARSDSIVKHPDLVAAWRDIGLDNVFIGFEKPDQDGLDSLNKHNSAENNEAALDILRKLGIEPLTSFIVDPEYDHRSFETLRAYVHKLRLKRPLFSVLTPLPGTAMFEEVREHLSTHDYRLFDLVHAVVPTRLDVADFYQEMARLYRAAYPRWKLMLAHFFLTMDRFVSARARAYSKGGMMKDVFRLCRSDGYGSRHLDKMAQS